MTHKNSKIRTVFRTRLILLHVAFLVVLPFRVNAELDWAAVTLDNDIFLGNDNGYTNGLYFSFFDLSSQNNKVLDNSYWVEPLMWTLPSRNWSGSVNAYMVGQTMSTPSDITIVIPDENELPYAAMLAFTNSYLVATSEVADRISTTLGIVGPSALGEETQKAVHELIGADEPLGWGTQLEDEIVFQFTRARAWRNWVSESGNVDFLTTVDFRVGTVQSAISSGLTVRYGRELTSSFPTTLFSGSRTTNPAAAKEGWYVYANIETGYVFNQIFSDGNTYTDSRSIDYDQEFVGVSFGLAYAWENWSVTFAISDANLVQSGNEEEALEDLTQYGSLTVAWRL